MPRPLKPSALLEQEKGKLYADQRDRAALEPKPRRDMKPRCPQEFTKAQRKCWKKVATMLKNYGLFTIANAVHLEFAAVRLAEHQELMKDVAKQGILIEGQNGQMVANQAWIAGRQVEELILKELKEMSLASGGLASIGSLMLKHKKQKSEMEELLD